MIIDWIHHYYNYFIIFSVLLAIGKIVFSIPLYKEIGGFLGMIILLFKWHSKHEREMTETEWRIKYMRFLNVLAILFYGSLLLLGILTLIKKIL